MQGRGIAWVPIAIGIFFIAEILVFSFAFTKVTIFARTVTDANVVFEGDEIETYARSIDNSIQLSIAQSLYDFFKKHDSELWQRYGSNLMPTGDAILSEVQGGAMGYFNNFVKAHEDYSASSGGNKITFGWDGGGSPAPTMKIDKAYVNMFIEPEMKLNKGPIDFASATFERKFVAESTLVTVFGEIKDRIAKLIGGGELTQQVLDAVGFQDYKPDTADSQNPEPGSYLNNQLSPDTSYSPEPSSFSWTDGASQLTQGYLEYCSSQTRTYASKPDEQDYSRIWDPGAEDVYKITHNSGGYAAAENSMLAGIESHVMGFLQLKLDKESTDYTVAFDEFSNKADVAGACFAPEAKGNCNCVCIEVDPITGGCILWSCNLYKSVTCQYNHLGAAQVTATFQEDGFVYGFGSVADNIKIVFKAIFGNAPLI